VEGVSRQYVHNRWHLLAASAGISANVDNWRDKLLSAWSEPHRHYHNLEHLQECLERLDEVRALCNDEIAVGFAIWFHDAVYDPRAPDNEERSADLARCGLHEMGCAGSLQDRVADLILATKIHDSAGDHDKEVLLDIDLSVLGSPHNRFSRYESDVRREFDWVPAGIFAEKRAAILRGFLRRPRIFHTEEFLKRYEAQARANLEWSIAQLRDDAGV
jgi:predicted metal-dependent HD superfamily phosphohydrolase